MKIDFILNSISNGGAERVMTTLVNNLNNKYNTTFITFNEGNVYPLEKNIKRVKLHHGKIKNHTTRSFINLFRYYKLKKNRPDIIVTFMTGNAFIIIPIAKLFGIKVIVSEHNNHKANPSTKNKFTRKYIYPFADYITILTSYDSSFFTKINSRTVIMANPILPVNNNTPLLSRKKNILAAGSFKRYKVKGFDKLITIIAPLLRENPDWSLTIAGSGEPGLTIIKELIRKEKLEHQVILPGFCNDLNRLMQDSQIFVLPSLYEGLPMVLMEALSNGMACVAYDCVSGPADLIEDNVNGLLVKDQCIDDFQKKLEWVMQNQEVRINLSQKAPNSMRPYHLENILVKWDKLFISVLNS